MHTAHIQVISHLTHSVMYINYIYEARENEILHEGNYLTLVQIPI